MTRQFAKLADDPTTDEYRLLQEVKRDNPSFRVTNHTIKKNPNKDCHKGLTYEYMKDFIKKFETKENAEKVLAELEELIFISKGHSKAYRYPTIKKWFLEAYPNYATFGKEVIETAERKSVELSFPTDEDAVA